MDKKDIKNAIEDVKKNSKQRKFSQSYDLIVNLQELNLKNPEEQVDFFVTLHFGIGKKIKVCGFVGPELQDQAKTICDFTVTQDEFPVYGDKKKVKRLAKTYDYFIAQANIMPKVAGIFGRSLGPRGKMPNPKAGCVVPGNANLKPLVDRLQTTIKVSAKKEPVIHLMVGKESQPDDEITDNIMTIYQQLIHHLPKEKHNIRNIYLKLTMGKPIKLT
ncbi:MAG: 50S ribosomal protein L1 [Nanoarchaeota archaeon]